MGILVKEGTTKRDWFKLAGATAEAAIKSLTLGKDGFSAAIPPLFRILESLRGEDSTERRAARFVLEVLSYSIAQTLQSIQLARAPLQPEVEAIVQQLLARVENLCDQQEVYLTAADLEHPSSFEIFDDVSSRIFHELKPNGPKAREAEVVAVFQRSVAEGLGRVRARNPQYFAPLFQVLSGPNERVDANEHAWGVYRERLIRRFEDEPLFGEDRPNGLRLGQVYQTLRGYWNEEDEPSAANSGTLVPPKTRRFLRMLDSLIGEWLENDDPQDRVRLISGGPGSGKSTFAKRLASSLAVRPEWRVVFVPLQRLKGIGPLEARINDYFRLQGDEPFELDTAPLLSMGRDGHRHWLVIFDGLDELAKEGPGSESAAQDFASALADWRARVGDVAARFLVLGRAPSMQEARRRLSLHGKGTLHVVGMAPLSKLENDEQKRISYDDPLKLRDVDQRPEFWRRWAVAKGLPVDPPEAMKADELTDLTNEPLLAYLLILSGYVSDRWREAAENRNRIYQAIFNHIWTREREKPTRIHLNDLGQECFESLLQALGLAAWRGGGRTGDEATFVVVRDNFMRPDLLARAKSSGASNLSNVALLFYTRKDEEGGRGYEFLHKSFGEYLTARGLFSAFQRWGGQVSDPTLDFDATEFLRRWLRLTGPAPITREILSFLRNEVRLASFNNDNQRPWQTARSLVPIAAKIVGAAVRDGLPAHEGAHRWRTAEREARNSEIALFGMLDAIARAAYPSNLMLEKKENGGWEPGPIVIPELKEPSAYANLLRRLFEAGSSSGWMVGANFFVEVAQGPIATTLSRLNLNETQLFGLTLSSMDLQGVSLKDAKLFGCTFTQCNLSGANLDSANLQFVSVIRCDIRRASFAGADLQDANFDKFTLSQSELTPGERKRFNKRRPHPDRIMIVGNPDSF